jgi:hypothetical protein
MPYGHFLVIENLEVKYIQQMALKLSLDRHCRILESYTVLFEQARKALGFTFRDLSFDNFTGLEVPPLALGVQPAD